MEAATWLADRGFGKSTVDIALEPPEDRWFTIDIGDHPPCDRSLVTAELQQRTYKNSVRQPEIFIECLSCPQSQGYG